MPEREADPRLQGALGLSKPIQRSFGRFATPKTRMRTGESPPPTQKGQVCECEQLPIVLTTNGTKCYKGRASRARERWGPP